ncbi:hypothetical protein SAMN05428939_0343 [Streptomyces sp. TLI_105]|nr:hypothetical protein SAMN05428939_0343 [Streptomyces sp. TLI_105]
MTRRLIAEFARLPAARPTPVPLLEEPTEHERARPRPRPKQVVAALMCGTEAALSAFAPANGTARWTVPLDAGAVWTRSWTSCPRIRRRCGAPKRKGA